MLISHSDDSDTDHLLLEIGTVLYTETSGHGPSIRSFVLWLQERHIKGRRKAASL